MILPNFSLVAPDEARLEIPGSTEKLDAIEFGKFSEPKDRPLPGSKLKAPVHATPKLLLLFFETLTILEAIST